MKANKVRSPYKRDVRSSAHRASRFSNSRMFPKWRSKRLTRKFLVRLSMWRRAVFCSCSIITRKHVLRSKKNWSSHRWCMINKKLKKTRVRICHSWILFMNKVSSARRAAIAASGPTSSRYLWTSISRIWTSCGRILMLIILRSSNSKITIGSGTSESTIARILSSRDTIRQIASITGCHSWAKRSPWNLTQIFL